MELNAVMTHTSVTAWCTAALLAAVLAVVAARGVPGAIPDQAALEKMTARFAPTEITADVGGLPSNERQALGKLVQASRLGESEPYDSAVQSESKPSRSASAIASVTPGGGPLDQ